MASIYESADIYDLLDNEDNYLIYQRHWETILRNRHIETFLDISIGSGSVTLPLSALGVQLTGSDLSETMLQNCRKKAQARNLSVKLQCCDFRVIAEHFTGKYDCVASTGNSLPYVNNEDVLKTLEQMDSFIKPGGYLYFDSRNWDMIIKEKPRFYLYNPFFDGDTRINLIQVWDYHDDGSVTFNLLYTFEKDNQIFRKEKFEEHYIPISKKTILDKLQKMGYKEISVMPFPSYSQNTNIDIEKVDWYCVIAQKS